jgi:mono/diheme cytochrome c family protein
MIRSKAAAAAVALTALSLSGAIPREAAPAQSRPGLSPFERDKAERLLKERLPCLGCHRLDGDGGAIGPDLSNVADRRSADFIRRMVYDPQNTLPGTIMPKTPMPDSWRDLVSRYLAERRGAGGEIRDPTPPASRPERPKSGRELYTRFCAPCHGASGRGDGPNAQYLPVRPTVHADSAYMSQRPDDTLFDGIYGGGYILNRSHRMPAFGLTLTREEIWALVRYLRELCRCQGPDWSRDGR